jgi:hypothetical protein
VAILLLTSAAGSPGVTTLAVGLTLAWPRPVLLADCDPGAHQAVLAGYLAGQSAGGRGLLRIAEAHRDRRPLREAVLDQTLPIAGEDGERQLFLPGFSRAASAGLFGGVWDDLADTFDRLGEVGYDVIVDAGRMAPHGLPGPLVERSAVTGLVLRTSLRAVMAARVHLPALTEQERLSTAGRTGLVLVGEGEPYGRREVAKALGIGVHAVVAHDPQVAAHLSDGQPRPRRFESSALVRSLRAAAGVLAGRMAGASAAVAQ